MNDLIPALLGREDYAEWLGEVEGKAEELRALLKPCNVPMEAVTVSPKVSAGVLRRVT